MKLPDEQFAAEQCRYDWLKIQETANLDDICAFTAKEPHQAENVERKGHEIAQMHKRIQSAPNPVWIVADDSRPGLRKSPNCFRLICRANHDTTETVSNYKGCCTFNDHLNSTPVRRGDNREYLSRQGRPVLTK